MQSLPLSRRFIFTGALALAAAGILFLAGVSHPRFADPRLDLLATAEQYATWSFLWSQLSVVLSFLLFAFGLFVFGIYLRTRSPDNEMSTVLGIGLSSVGVLFVMLIVLMHAFVRSDSALAYLNFHEPSVMGWAQRTSLTNSERLLGYLGSIPLLLGVGCLTIALRQDAAMATWPAYVLLSGLLGWVIIRIWPFAPNTIPSGYVSYSIELVSGLLSAIGNNGLALNLVRAAQNQANETREASINEA